MLLLMVRVSPGTLASMAMPILPAAASRCEVQIHLQEVRLKNLMQETLLLSKLQSLLGFDLLTLFVRLLLLPVRKWHLSEE